MKNKKIFYILFPAFCIIGLIGLFVISAIVNQNFKKYFYERTWNDLESLAYVVSLQIEEIYQGDQNYKTNNLLSELGKKTKTRFTLVNKGSQVIADSEIHPDLVVDTKSKPEFKEAFLGKIGRDRRFNSNEMDEETRLYVAVPLIVDNEIVGVLRSSRADSEIQLEIEKFMRQIVIASIIIALLMGLVSLIMSKLLSLPMEYMRNQAIKMSEGDLSTRIQLDGVVPSELKELASGINSIAVELDKRLHTISTQKQEQDAIFGSMSEGVLAISGDLEIIHFNRAAAQILSLNSADALGKSVSEFILHPEFKNFILDSISKKLPAFKEVVLYRSAEEQVVQLQSRPILIDESKRAGAVFVFSDITRLRELESHRQEFVANVSHELRTPLTSIRGFAETLMAPAVTEEDRIRFLNIIHRHASRLGDVIEDLLALSRLENSDNSDLSPSLKFEEQKIYPLIAAAKEICDIKARDLEIAINVDADKDLVSVVNGSLLERAIVNLVDNALKYSPPKSEINVLLKEESDKIIITVKDNGPGIGKEHLNRLFERFYRIDRGRDRGAGGTGLGLSIVKHVALVHLGDVHVESEMGKGSEFSIVIPRA